MFNVMLNSLISGLRAEAGIPGRVDEEASRLEEMTPYGRTLKAMQRKYGSKEPEYMVLARAAFDSDSRFDGMTPAQYQDMFTPAVKAVAKEISQAAAPIWGIGQALAQRVEKDLMAHPTKRPEAFHRLGQIAKRLREIHKELADLSVEIRRLK